MTAADLTPLEAAPAGERIAYGSGVLQFGELQLPTGEGPYPLVIFVHGGCWLAAYDLRHTRSLAQSLASNGYAVWNLEYRRVGDDGGGWPGTFTDVAAGADYVRQLATRYPIDLSRVLTMGHSAGGQLALWLAGRHNISSASEVFTAEPLAISGVLALAPAAELRLLYEQGQCDNAAARLMGGSPSSLPARYAAASPADLAPLGVPIEIVLGQHDRTWTPIGRAYVQAARAAGEQQIKVTDALASGHFEMINPATNTWELVLAALARLLGSQQ